MARRGMQVLAQPETEARPAILEMREDPEIQEIMEPVEMVGPVATAAMLVQQAPVSIPHPILDQQEPEELLVAVPVTQVPRRLMFQHRNRVATVAPVELLAQLVAPGEMAAPDLPMRAHMSPTMFPVAAVAVVEAADQAETLVPLEQMETQELTETQGREPQMVIQVFQIREAREELLLQCRQQMQRSM